jgi:hypothetical protein
VCPGSWGVIQNAGIEWLWTQCTPNRAAPPNSLFIRKITGKLLEFGLLSDHF